MIGPFAGFKWLALISDWSIFAEGFIQTILLSVLALTLSLLLGIFLGLLGTSDVKILRVCNRIYVEFIQNTPLVIQIFFLYHVWDAGTGLLSLGHGSCPSSVGHGDRFVVSGTEHLSLKYAK